MMSDMDMSLRNTVADLSFHRAALGGQIRAKLGGTNQIGAAGEHAQRARQSLPDNCGHVRHG